MLERFLPRWFQQPTEGQGPASPTTAAEAGLPLSVGREKPKSKSKWKGGDLKLVSGAAIGYPIPKASPLSLTGIEAPDNIIRAPGQWQHSYSHPSPTRSGPSNVEWMVDASDAGRTESVHNAPSPPEVVRLASQTKVNPISRALSAPSLSTPHDSATPSSTSSSSSSPAGTPTSKGQSGLRLNTNPVPAQSANTLRLDAPASVTTDVYAHAYNYPLAKQLSPIEEQDYFSPVSLRTPISLPNGSDDSNDSNASIAYAMSFATNPSPVGSQKSEIGRPSPSYSTPHPFITRQVNRTISQTSSRTQTSTTSLPRASSSTAAKSAEPPLLPPLSLAPPFPGPHPSHGSSGPPLRPRRSMQAMPTIEGSSESAVYDAASEVYGGEDDLESLHADSFITASAQGEDAEMDIADVSFQMSIDTIESGPGESIQSHDPPGPAASVRSDASMILPASASESFIGRRWERDAALGSGVVTFRARRQWLSDCTPAFWTFWLGFFFPVLWFVGGWHFTHFGEQPPRLTFWEFYFNAAFWKEKVFDCVLCCGARKLRTQPKEVVQRPAAGHEYDTEAQAGSSGPRLPRWVAEKQSSDDGRLRLQDPKRSLRGISFGYPFIPRPVSMRRSSMTAQPVRWRRRVMNLLEKPHRLFDYFYGVKLREVRGRPESGRRIFDPWIQRCRYAFCYALLFLCLGLCAACTLLIVFNTRQLR
ncbi:hypothetical protein DXG01_008563 [Tephrocybe rancida]|nr:hypothetical protein DXG01_008563 [Tephrocybe rancida]